MRSCRGGANVCSDGYHVNAPMNLEIRHAATNDAPSGDKLSN